MLSLAISIATAAVLKNLANQAIFMLQLSTHRSADAEPYCYTPTPLGKKASYHPWGVLKKHYDSTNADTSHSHFPHVYLNNPLKAPVHPARELAKLQQLLCEDLTGDRVYTSLFLCLFGQISSVQGLSFVIMSDAAHQSLLSAETHHNFRASTRPTTSIFLLN